MSGAQEKGWYVVTSGGGVMRRARTRAEAVKWCLAQFPNGGRVLQRWTFCPGSYEYAIAGPSERQTPGMYYVTRHDQLGHRERDQTPLYPNPDDPEERVERESLDDS